MFRKCRLMLGWTLRCSSAYSLKLHASLPLSGLLAHPPWILSRYWVQVPVQTCDPFAGGMVLLFKASFSVGTLAPATAAEEDDEAAFATGPGPTVLTGISFQVLCCGLPLLH